MHVKCSLLCIIECAVCPEKSVDPFQSIKADHICDNPLVDTPLIQQRDLASASKFSKNEFKKKLVTRASDIIKNDDIEIRRTNDHVNANAKTHNRITNDIL